MTMLSKYRAYYEYKISKWFAIIKYIKAISTMFTKILIEIEISFNLFIINT